MDNKYILITVAILAFGGFLVWLFIASSKPLPGIKVADLGRKHVPASEKVDYNSNPPTSGSHYADWVRSGIYEAPKEDGNLIHSLEHGYVIMSYNCEKQGTGYRLQGTVYAHGIEEEATSSASESSPSATLSAAFRSADCHKLVDQLISVYEKKGKKKLIVIPRPNMDVRIALTAWTYIDKFDQFDASRIEKFIDTHLNQGPEKTVEQ
ncbi:DUF3105 domain-containing protein [Candidatus Daviesbacteria bacterium]|nr:DUF3105 domain-containing protein [Candidatus Daviesbacteria bacterium]